MFSGCTAVLTDSFSSVPCGLIIMALLYLVVPNGFPYHALAPGQKRPSRTAARLDIFGAFLFLAATVLLVTGVEEGGTRFAWKSVATICMLVFAVVCWTGFLVWERYVTLGEGKLHPVLPWRFICTPSTIGLLLYVFLFLPHSFFPRYADSH